MRGLRLAGLVALLAGAAAFVLATRGRDAARTIEPEGERSIQAPSAPLIGAPGAEGAEAVAASDARVAAPAERSLLAGRVVTTAGAAVEGADVAWAPSPEAFCEGAWRWSAAESASAERLAARAVTDSEGRFALAELDAPCGAALWVSKPGFLATFRALGPDGAPPAEPITLHEQQAVLIRVIGPSGEAVPGATVLQRGLALAPAAAPYKDRWAAYLFFQRTICDAAGTARIAAFPGEQRVQAEIDGVVSVPRSVHPGTAEVELRLEATFLLSGTARIEGPFEPPPDVAPALTLEVSAVDGSVRRPLLERSVAPGELGPIPIPLEAAPYVHARLSGPGLQPDERILPRPTAGETVRVDLAARAGVEQWCRVTDPEGRGLADASVEVAWIEGRERRSVRVPSRGDGYVRVLGVRPGSVVVIASCPGYASSKTEAFDVPSDPPRTVEIALAPACVLEGRVVTWEGRAVRDFAVTYWPKDDARRQITKAFRDRPDGAFSIDDVAEGEWMLVASAAESSGSEPAAASASSKAKFDVELVLLAPAVGRGRVVLESTGDPVANAVVHLYTMGGSTPIAAYGPGEPADANGEFQLDRCTNGRNAILVTAEGRASRFVEADGAEGRVEFGTIALPEPAEVEVVLWSRGPAAGFRVRVDGPDARAGLRLEDGPRGPRSLLSGLSPGYYAIELERPDGSLDVALADLHPGPNPPVIFHGDDEGGALQVGVTLGPDAGSTRGSITIEGKDEDGRVRQRVVSLGADDAYLIQGLLEGRAEAFLTDAQSRVIATAAAQIVTGEVRAVHLSTGDTPVRIRLARPTGEPVAGAWTYLTDARDGSSGPVGTTGADGELAFASVRPGAYLLTAEHPLLGMLVDREVHVPESRREVLIELAFSAPAEIHARVVDGDVPLPGIACTLLGATGNVLAEPRATDADGGVSFQRLSEGRYRMSLVHESIWPDQALLNASPGAAPETLSVRRLGDATLTITSPAGPVAGIAAELIDLETGTAVAAWVEEGRVQRSPEHGTSDAHGRIEWKGLPRGAYSWSLPAHALSGVLIVPPGGEAEAPITVP